MAQVIVADGWVLDGLASDRLIHQLDRAPREVVGVAASTGALPPGTSYRVHAERSALLPLAEVVAAAADASFGAVALRPDVDAATGDGLISVAGPMLVDRGAHVHDTNAPLPPVSPASPLGRPPFPWRPVVAFVAVDAPTDLTGWAHRLADELLAHEVEGRLCASSVAEGSHLTSVCTPDDASLAALAPSIVVPLDAAARVVADRRAADDTSMMLIELAPDAAGVEPVSWRLGSASGRVRARLSRSGEAGPLADMVKRLCAGPHPIELSERDDATGGWREGIDSIVSAIRSPQRPEEKVSRSAIVLTSFADRAAGRSSSHLDGLVDHLEAAGHVSHRHDLVNGWPVGLESAELVLVEGILSSDAQPVVDRRRPAGLPTVADVRRGDPDEIELAVTCGLAVASSDAVLTTLNDRGVRAQLVPTMITRERDTELRKLRATVVEPEPVVGVRIDDAASADPLTVQALAKAMTQLLEDDPELQLVLVGEVRLAELGPELEGRVTVLDDPPPVTDAARWLAVVLVEGDADGASDALTEASHMGIPAVVEATSSAARVARHPAELLVDRPADSDAWIDAIRPLVTEPGTRARACRDVARHSDALHGPSSSAAVVGRFLGWVDRGSV